MNTTPTRTRRITRVLATTAAAATLITGITTTAHADTGKFPPEYQTTFSAGTYAPGQTGWAGAQWYYMHAGFGSELETRTTFTAPEGTEFTGEPVRWSGVSWSSGTAPLTPEDSDPLLAYPDDGGPYGGRQYCTYTPTVITCERTWYFSDPMVLRRTFIPVRILESASPNTTVTSVATLEAGNQRPDPDTPTLLRVDIGAREVVAPVTVTWCDPQPGVDLAVSLCGTGEPGADIEAVLDGQVVGTTIVAAGGTWGPVTVTGLRPGVPLTFTINQTTSQSSTTTITTVIVDTPLLAAATPAIGLAAVAGLVAAGWGLHRRRAHGGARAGVRA